MRWLGMSRRWRSMAAGLSLACLIAACGGGKDGPTGPGGGGGDFAGDYLLVGADDAALPAVVTSNGCSAIQIVNGGLTLGADGQFQMQFNWQDVNGQAQFSGDHGRYQVRDGGLEFTSEAWGDQFEGEMDGGVLWLSWDYCGDTPGQELDLAFTR